MKPTGAEAPDIFVSYARKNRPVAEQLAEALAASGLQVWWDSDLTAGSEFATVIEAKLQGAAVVIVLWSADSVRSSFVRDECSRALRHNKLVPVRIEDIELPLGFGQLHTLDLLDWDGDAGDHAFEKLLLEVRQRRRSKTTGSMPEPPRSAARRWPRPSTLLAGAALALALGGGAAWYVRDLQEREATEEREAKARADKLQRDEARRIDAIKVEAERHFRAGLDLQIADVPQLEKALNEYLSAIERRPEHARAHYYLGHVYAQTGRPADALASFRLALVGTEAQLDRGQRAEAEKQVLALVVVEGEEAPITRVSAAPEPQPAPAPAAESGTGQGSGRGSSGTVAAARPPRADGLDPGIVTRSIQPKPARPAAAAAPAIVAAAPVVAAPRQPPRSAPPEATAATLAKSVDAMFNDNKESRITATTALVLDPQALSDAVPLAVAKAQQVIARGGPGAMSSSDSSGVVNTLVLLQSALPGTLQVNRAEIERLLVAATPLGDYTAQQAGKVREALKQAPARRPLAYIQIANEAQRPIAETLALKMRSFGYDAPGIELVAGRAPERTQVRLQGKSDRSYARWVGKAVADAIDAQPLINVLRNAKPGVDTYEIWFGRQLCAPGGRVLAGCKQA
ncbi:MAG: TIR domain-containing protein [Burkholderiaceae bacterium]